MTNSRALANPSANRIGNPPIRSPTPDQAPTFRKRKTTSPLWASVTTAHSADSAPDPRRITASGDTDHHHHHHYYCYCWQSYLNPPLPPYHNRGVTHALGTPGFAIIVTTNTPTDKGLRFHLGWCIGEWRLTADGIHDALETDQILNPERHEPGCSLITKYTPRQICWSSCLPT